ncbi:3-deoxy-7-phosphoheptulonate synthase [Engelhardtia mirabilis]|uniref:Phospho-2-dehydro-3-deoxyheptonate aldolase n=1 Tax=Engelhardtia mirabilis TaxID=2528011 RepID=A0A518BRV1_9BACT|nr:Phospho-2-dehydro-3-deoxyheptonate aldolase [Planctomycetes bacterium Pla133]QDV04027.1 Phospho-2-dehydro-3-deoxyheptonate aldolase [Planctomycetes bacterium Pla86]
MLLSLRPDADDAQLAALRALADEGGFELRFLDERRRVAELVGARGPHLRSRLEDLKVVREILDPGQARELHERNGRPDTVVRIGDAVLGGGHASLIAGPCAVESRDRLLEIAHAAHRAGATVLRGGAFKPRTSPHSFQGLGAEGLLLLEEAREATGLAILTEVLDPRDVELVGRSADAFQIGARSMANAALLREVGLAGKPVLLKRGLAATVREFCLAAEYVLDAGNDQVILCERGVRGFDRVTRNLLDLGAVAHLKGATHLPVIVDPSHAAGRADLVPALARAGLAAGADGLIIEAHPRPDEARSDAPQAVSLDDLAQIAADARAILALDGRILAAPRRELVGKGV